MTPFFSLLTDLLIFSDPEFEESVGLIGLFNVGLAGIDESIFVVIDRIPKVIKYNSTTSELVDSLINEVINMNKQLQIQLCIKDYEGGIIDKKEYNKKLPTVAKNAILDACTGTNPRIPTQEEMEKLLLCLYYNSPVDF